MSEATKRKHVYKEIFQGELVPPTKNQLIVKVLANKGNNLHEVQSSDSKIFLVSMPNKFRKIIWIKRGDYVLVELIKEGEKVKAEIVTILTPDYIKFLMNENIWPSEFLPKTGQESEDNISDIFGNYNRKTISDNESSEDNE